MLYKSIEIKPQKTRVLKDCSEKGFRTFKIIGNKDDCSKEVIGTRINDVIKIDNLMFEILDNGNIHIWSHTKNFNINNLCNTCVINEVPKKEENY